MKPTTPHENVRGQKAWWRAATAVAWSFLGIRRRSAYESDLQSVQPLHVLVVGLVAVLVFVGVLIGIVRWVVLP